MEKEEGGGWSPVNVRQDAEFDSGSPSPGSFPCGQEWVDTTRLVLGQVGNACGVSGPAVALGKAWVSAKSVCVGGCGCDCHVLPVLLRKPRRRDLRRTETLIRQRC
jgi:hypothetical protein